MTWLALYFQFKPIAKFQTFDSQSYSVKYGRIPAHKMAHDVLLTITFCKVRV